MLYGNCVGKRHSVLIMTCFIAKVAIVPFLKAPGFIKADVVDSAPLGRIFPDINGCSGIEVTLKADSNYTGLLAGGAM
eukprot:711418-Amphidinium_carterae.1